MNRLSIAAALAFSALASPAEACMADAPLDLHDLTYADVVVIGRITGYRIVSPRAAGRRGHAPLGPISDYARFDVLVDEILKGAPTKRIRVSWDNSTFAEPARMPPG